jgi:ATP-dependent Clp protease ATP-binding subunit ClpA
VVIMTSNLAGRAILERAKAPGGPEAEEALQAEVDQALARQFRPEFLNRIDEVIRFRPLGKADLGRIVRLQLQELAALLAEQQLRLEVDEAVVGALAERGYEPEYGARPLRRLMRRWIENPLATQLLEEHFTGAWGVRLCLGPADQPERLQFLPLRQEGGSVR